MSRDEFTPAQEAEHEAEQAMADDARDEYVRLTTRMFATGIETSADFMRRVALAEAWPLEDVDELDDVARRRVGRES